MEPNPVCPVYFGFESQPKCPEHGEMSRVNPQFITRNGTVYTLRRDACIAVCGQCCRSYFIEEYDIPVPKETATEALWRDTADDEWDNHVENLFTKLGQGRIDTDGDAIIRRVASDAPERIINGPRVFTPSGP